MSNINNNQKDKLFKNYETFIPTIEDINEELSSIISHIKTRSYITNFDRQSKFSKYSFTVQIPNYFKTNLNDENIVKTAMLVKELEQLCEGNRISLSNLTNHSDNYQISNSYRNSKTYWNWYLELAICVLNGFIISSFKSEFHPMIFNLNSKIKYKTDHLSETYNYDEDVDIKDEDQNQDVDLKLEKL